MIEINIENKKFFVDNFPQKKSDLNKFKNKLTLQIPVYTSSKHVRHRVDIELIDEISTELLHFFKNLKELPKSIILNKGNVYFWKLNGIQLLGILIKSKKEYFEYDKTTIELTISYEDVYGTHDLTLLNRVSKLDELLNT
jgi:hypothetical protein